MDRMESVQFSYLKSLHFTDDVGLFDIGLHHDLLSTLRGFAAQCEPPEMRINVSAWDHGILPENGKLPMIEHE